MYSIKKTSFIVSLVGLFAIGVAQAEMHATEEFESGETRPVTVAVLPAQVNLIRQRMLRREAQVEEAGELEAHLSSAVAGELGVKAYEVELITAERINADPELQALVVLTGDDKPPVGTEFDIYYPSEHLRRPYDVEKVPRLDLPYLYLAVLVSRGHIAHVGRE